MRRRRILIITAFATVSVVIVAVFARYQGLVLPVRIASGSMAEALLGPHRVVQCSQCGFAFRCGVDTEAPLDQATCPNCGFAGNELSGQAVFGGDRVLIDRCAYWFDKPQRGDIVAIVDPVDRTQLAVKRVGGLPSESVSIRGGELFIDGEVHRKSRDEALELATLVYDDTFRVDSEKDLPTRWDADTEATAWTPSDRGFVWKSTDAASGQGDWLTYRHWRCYASPHRRTEEAPISDHYAYNQGLSRTLYEVSDVILTCQITCPDKGHVSFLIHDGRESFTFKLSPQSRSIELIRGDSQLVQASVPATIDCRDAQIAIAVIDQQLIFAIADDVLIRETYPPLESPFQPTSRPLAISTNIDQCTIDELKVFRDVYYLNQHLGNWAWRPSPVTVPANCLFLLGDNQPLSNDSRHWKRPFVSETDVIGKVTLLSR